MEETITTEITPLGDGNFKLVTITQGVRKITTEEILDESLLQEQLRYLNLEIIRLEGQIATINAEITSYKSKILEIEGVITPQPNEEEV